MCVTYYELCWTEDVTLLFLLTFLCYVYHPHNVGCPLSHYETRAQVNLQGAKRFLASSDHDRLLKTIHYVATIEATTVSQRRALVAKTG